MNPFTALALALIAIPALQAGTIFVTLVGTGPSDGANFALPYQLQFTDDTGTYSSPADCYSLAQQVTLGQTWEANVFSVSQAAASGMFGGQPDALAEYELIGVLSTLAAPTDQNKIDLQHAIWNVFAPGQFSTTPGMSAYDSTALAEIPGFDFSGLEYLEPVAGGEGQPMVTSAPEPRGLLLFGFGLTLLYVLRRREHSPPPKVSFDAKQSSA